MIMADEVHLPVMVALYHTESEEYKARQGIPMKTFSGPGLPCIPSQWTAMASIILSSWDDESANKIFQNFNKFLANSGQDWIHEFHENHHSVSFFHKKKPPNDAVTPQRQSQFTPKMKANAVSRLLSSLVWIDQYNDCNGMTSFKKFMLSLMTFLFLFVAKRLLNNVVTSQCLLVFIALLSVRTMSTIKLWDVTELLVSFCRQTSKSYETYVPLTGCLWGW